MMTETNTQKMDAKTYQVEAQRTAPTAVHSTQDWLNLVTLGMVGESGELANLFMSVNPNKLDTEFLNNVIKESGDVYWYVAVACDKNGLQIDDMIAPDSAVLEYLRAERQKLGGTTDALTFAVTTMVAGVLTASQISEMTKKVNYHQHALNLERFEELLRTLMAAIQITHLQFGVSSEEVMATNIAKLRARYPDKFTTELSLAKLDEKEEATEATSSKPVMRFA